MKKLAISIIVFFTILFPLAFIACDNLDENFSTNPNHRLAFSVDTLSFDTVFTSIGSATRQFMVYNRNSKPLLIQDITLAGAGKTGFRINVDGRKGEHFTDIQIQEKDSLYIFVEVTVNPNDKDQPILIGDSVLFTTNGNRQSVRLEAYGQDVNLYKGGTTIKENTQLTAARPYLVYDSLVINPGITVEIEKGAIFYMHDTTAKIINYGTLIARGTLEEPILFRGDRLDDIIPAVLPYDCAPAQWGGIIFQPESYDNILDHVIMRNGKTGLTFRESSPERSKLKMNNSQITNMSENLFKATNCHIEVVNSELSNAGGNLAMLTGGRYSFIHCTLANYITLVKRNDVCLTLSNTLDNQTFPLDASFDNSIIDGSFSPKQGEIHILTDKETGMNYRFNHCVIKSNGENDEQFTNVLFGSSPSYRRKGTNENEYRFDFHPDSLTTLGVGKADLSVSRQYPVDRCGNSRLTENGPAIGAYEFIPKENEEEK